MAEERIGRYRILEEIAAGTQGAVYRAFDPDNDRLVAVKVLHPHLTGDATYLARFAREASIAASIDHPNVVRIYEVGEDDGRHFIAMEFLPENLQRLIQGSGGLRVESAVEFAAQIADGLAAAHAAGIVHRDIKPQNVLIGTGGEAGLTDFGIARAESLTAMTVTGTVMGTPYYMSPEQCRGEPADARSDLYSLGVVLYQLLTDELPFVGSLAAVVHSHIYEQPKPITELRPELPAEVAAIVERAMQKDPDARFASAAQMAAALRDAVPAPSADPTPAVPPPTPEPTRIPPTPPQLVNTTPPRSTDAASSGPFDPIVVITFIVIALIAIVGVLGVLK